MGHSKGCGKQEIVTLLTKHLFLIPILTKRLLLLHCRHIEVRFSRLVRLIPPKRVPHRTNRRIASRREATLRNLTQRLLWGGRRGKSLRNRMHGFAEKRALFSPQGAFTPAKVRLLFQVTSGQKSGFFVDFGGKATKSGSLPRGIALKQIGGFLPALLN